MNVVVGCLVRVDDLGEMHAMRGCRADPSDMRR